MKTVASSVMRRKKDESEIDLTPMLDVVFILLIFFVVTATFLKESALDIQGQDPNNNPPPPPPDAPQNVLIEVNAQDLITFNQERVDIAAVRARIAQVRAENPSASVVIKPNNNSTANALVELINSAQEAGVSNISVMNQ